MDRYPSNCKIINDSRIPIGDNFLCSWWASAACWFCEILSSPPSLIRGGETAGYYISCRCRQLPQTDPKRNGNESAYLYKIIKQWYGEICSLLVWAVGASPGAFPNDARISNENVTRRKCWKHIPWKLLNNQLIVIHDIFKKVC